MRIWLLSSILAVAACGGDAFAPTPDDVFGQWSLVGEGLTRTYLNEPAECEVRLDFELVPDTVSKFVYPDDYVTAYYAWTGPDGHRSCTSEGHVNEGPFLPDGFFLVVMDGAWIELWHPNGMLMYDGEIASRSRMGGTIPDAYVNLDGRWFATRR